MDRSYGACFVGPPGSGKTSCVNVLKQYCDKLHRNTIVVNIDPANEHLPYTPTFDICSLITVKSVMKDKGLGPNGALIFCMDFLAENADQVISALKPEVTNCSYILIDAPGQVELYTHCDSVRKFLMALIKDLNASIATVNLVDICLASTKDGFLGQSIMSLSMMLRLLTPHINVLSKFDLAENYELPYNPFNDSFEDLVVSGVPSRLHKAIVELLDMYDLVTYSAFSIHDETTVMELIELIDKAVGCTFML